MRLATWNVNSLGARLPRVTEWIAEQRTRRAVPPGDEAGRRQVPRGRRSPSLGYETVHHGDGRWNGVAIVSRLGSADPVRGFDSAEDEHGCRIIAATCGGVRVHSVYVPNGRSLDNEFYAIKLQWLARLRTMLDEAYKPGDSVAICGDFNVAP